MSNFFIAIAAVAVVLGFMILIHEFGHYAVAKLLGVRVEVFSIGFDDIPRIIESAVSASNSGKLGSIAEVLEADAEARRYAQERVAMHKKTAPPRATSVV